MSTRKGWLLASGASKNAAATSSGGSGARSQAVAARACSTAAGTAGVLVERVEEFATVQKWTRPDDETVSCERGLELWNSR